MTATLAAPVVSLVIGIFRKGISSAGRGAVRAGKGFNKIYDMDKNFQLFCIF